RSLREEWSCGAWWCSFPDKPPAHSENRWGRERGRSIPFSECRERTLTSRCRPISIYEDLGDATKERWNAPGFRERRHAPVRPCPHAVACGFRGRIGADGDAR